MKKFLTILSLVLLAACSTPPTVTVTGNGTCHPAQDLPDHKTIKKLPEVETPLEQLWVEFLQERKDHGSDVRDYNSLYNTCVKGDNVIQR